MHLTCQETFFASYNVSVDEGADGDDGDDGGVDTRLFLFIFFHLLNMPAHKFFCIYPGIEYVCVAVCVAY